MQYSSLIIEPLWDIFAQASPCSRPRKAPSSIQTFYFFTPLRTRRQKFNNYPESRGFSADHPHTTYINVLKFSIFGGGGQQTRQLINFWYVLGKKIKSLNIGGPTHSSPYPLLATPQEGGIKHHYASLITTLPLPSLLFKEGRAITLHDSIELKFEIIGQIFSSPLRSLRILSLNPKSRQRCCHAFGRSGFWKTMMCSGLAETLALSRMLRIFAAYI